MFDEITDKRITAITPTKRDAGRAMVKVGGKVMATLSYKLIEDLGLAVDQVWTQELEEAVTKAGNYDKAMRAAMNRINRRAMTCSELRRKLKEKEHGEEAIGEVIERLTELGVLDDRAMGQAIIREMTGRKPAGVNLVRQKLYQKGLARDLIEELTGEFVVEYDQGELAVRFAEVKLKSMGKLDGATRKRRLWGALARRGFNSDVIGEVMQRLSSLLEDDTKEDY